MIEDKTYTKEWIIATRGGLKQCNFAELQNGIKRLSSFIIAKSFHIDNVIIAAAKAAFLSRLIKKHISTPDKFNKILPTQLIANADYSKLNKLKKSNPEAFFYWYKAVEN